MILIVGGWVLLRYDFSPYLSSKFWKISFEVNELREIANLSMRVYTYGLSQDVRGYFATLPKRLGFNSCPSDSTCFTREQSCMFQNGVPHLFEIVGAIPHERRAAP